LRKIEQLEKEGVFEVNWLMGLLRELMESMFIWVSENKEILATKEENVSSKPDEAKQVFISFPSIYSLYVYAERVKASPPLICSFLPMWLLFLFTAKSF